MKARILSPVVCRVGTLAVVAITTNLGCPELLAQSGAGLFTDPATGIVYQQSIRTVERPVEEIKMESREQTVYRPQTVTQSTPETRTVFSPVIEYKWEPRLHGRWNPFQQPTVAYHHVPQARWEARNELVHRTNTRTEWVAETRTIDVPQRTVRMEREQKVELLAVGRVAPQTQAVAGASDAIASRLRPLDASTRVEPITTPQYANHNYAAPRIAASSVGRLTSDPPARTIGQGGMRATELAPGPTIRGQALPPASGGVGVANLPSLPFFR